MTDVPYERFVLASAVLQHFPPSIRESLVSDPIFRASYGIEQDAMLSLDKIRVSVKRSELFGHIREFLEGRSDPPTLKDEAGKEWRLELIEAGNERRVGLWDGEHRLILPEYYALSPDQSERLKSFDRDANEVNLSEQATSTWREILASRALSDAEMDELHRDLEDTPIRQAALIGSAVKTGKVSLSTFVPLSAPYFDSLVGEYGQAQNIVDYARTAARKHVRQLISWRAYDGFLLSFLLSSHLSIPSVINTDHLEEKDLIHAYEWLQNEGDRISQIGAIEIGLSILDKRPEIEPYLQAIIEKIRDDNADDQSQFRLLSSLIMLVEGELARTKVLRGKPAFWRRLASIAQASLIERQVIRSNLDVAKLTQWAMEIRGHLFYVQTVVDLRLEPRWLPEYVLPHQLKAELVGRIVNAAQENNAKINSPAMRELLFGEGPEGLKSLMEFPYPYLPGPLEGGLGSPNKPPAEILKIIEEQLNADVLRPHSFIALVNSAPVFRLDSDQAQLAAKALRAGKHQLRQADSKEQMLTVLRNLATVAAVTRSGELAEELRILTRKWRHEPGRNLSAEEGMWIGVVAAAAHSGLRDWCDFVGEWITELAFQPLQRDEVESLYDNLKQLCQIVPELWCTCGRAEAALSASVGT